MRRHKKSKMRSAAVLAVCGLIPSEVIVRGADNSDLLVRANHAYYDTKRDGLTGFRCEVVPAWDQIYSSVLTNTAVQELMPILRQAHYEVSIGSAGTSTVSRKFDLDPPNEQAAERLRATSAIVEQVITGFFHVWSMFFGPPFPNPNDKSVTVEDVNGQYRITGKLGDSEISESMDRGLMISDMKIATAGTEFTVRPNFSRVPKGYILTGFQGNIKTASGTVPIEAIIENQAVDDFELPKLVTVGGSNPFPLSFRGCEVKKRK